MRRMTICMFGSKAVEWAYAPRSSWGLTMSPSRKIQSPPPPVYPDPPPADYRDVVSDKTMNALKEFVETEFKGEELEIISGPAW
jgi:hypothetical protein